MDNKYYKDINIIRVIACLGVLLYHLNILKGGYLAVCTFFVLSAYLSCVSAFKQEKFSIVTYYRKLLLKTYIPLAVIIFIVIGLVSCLNISWFNMKPEVTSVLLNYNNFWQLNSNLDYFARHISSPFMHLWYMSILIQFDILFPFIYLLLRKLGDKTKKIIPCLVTIVLAFISYGYFYYSSLNNGIMVSYYSTLSRLYSLLFGLALGFIHCYYSKLIFSKIKNSYLYKIIFSIYLLVLICFFIFADAKSIYMEISMLLVSIISCRLIDYATINMKNDLTWFDKIIKSLANVSYEIYLFQYPVIFLFQEMRIVNWLKILLVIVLTILSSYLFHYVINYNKKSRVFKIIRYLLCVVIFGIFAYGIYNYFISKDYTEEMKQLEQELLNNQKLILEKQKEYQNKINQEESDFYEALSNFEDEEANLENIVSNLNVVGIGDSVLLGAIPNLYAKFPNGYFDGEVSRTPWVVNDLLINLKNKNMLGNLIILNLGTNGDCSEECRIDIMKTCEDRDVFWLTVNNGDDPLFNDRIKDFALKYDNLHIIDWHDLSQGHTQYFYADGIHLTESGRVAYANAVYDAIYNLYLQRYNKQKEEFIKNHEQQEKAKISFYGNDILLNVYDYLHENFATSKFNIKKYDFKTLKNEIENDIKNNSLNYKVVLSFDDSVYFSKEEYEQLVKLCDNHEVYILAVNKDIVNIVNDLSYDNVKIIDFSEKMKKEYMMIDNIHLTDKGNDELSKLLINSLT